VISARATQSTARMVLATQRGFERLVTTAKGVLDGLWLGVLGTDTLHAVDQAY
jgi:hypothetical protein